jgi:hypothetical protein
MTNQNLEFLVTAQVYEKTDPYKQTILLHDVFFTSSSDKAEDMFNSRFEDTHNIIKIYSSINISNNTA